MARHAVYLGLDLGTSGCRAVAVTDSGAVAASARVSYPTSRPSPGLAEQWPVHWEQAALEALRTVAEQVGQQPSPGHFEYHSLTLTGQMAGLVVVDREGANPRPALIWQDARAAGAARRLAVEWGREAYRRSGCVPSAVYPITKMHELRYGQDGSAVDLSGWSEVRWVLSPRDELLRRLSGVIATDPSCAAATGWLDVHALQWDAELCQWSGVDHNWLPPLTMATESVGFLNPSAAQRAGLPAGLPVVLGAGDGVTQNVGLGVTTCRRLVVSLGTSGVVRTVTNDPSLDLDAPRLPRWTIYPFLARGDQLQGADTVAWVVNGATADAAGVLDWLSQTVAGQHLDLASVAAIRPGADGLLFLPFLSGTRSPWWQPEARGVLWGLTTGHGAGHVARAAIEGVAMSLRAIVDAMRGGGLSFEHGVIAGGGAFHRVVRDIVAGVLGLPLYSPSTPGLEAAWGAAVLGRACEIRAEAGYKEIEAVQRAAAELVPSADEVAVPAHGPNPYEAIYSRFIRLVEALLPLLRDTLTTGGI